MNLSKLSPARLYAIAAAGVALIATWWQDAPVPAILALVAAILGTGEVADRKKKKANGGEQ
jgi:phosphate/sulfate permease